MKNQFQEEKKRNFATNRKEFPKRRARRDDEMKMYGGLPYVSEVRLQKSRVSSFPFVYLDFLVEFDSHYARVQRALTNIIALRSRQISRRCLETLIASRETRQRDQKIRVPPSKFPDNVWKTFEASLCSLHRYAIQFFPENVSKELRYSRS